MQSSLAEFLAYYEAAHRSVANRYVHHVAHTLATAGVLFLWRPVWAVLLIAAAFVLSWGGHFLFERNTPAFFDAAEQAGTAASLVKKAQVAVGGVVWSFACLLRVFRRGPLAQKQL